MTMADILADGLRARGLPLAELRHDPSYEWVNDPDERVVERSEYLFRAAYRERHFTAPLFHWRFRDGRRFSGRPRVRLQHRVWAGFLCGGETYTEDRVLMLEELGQMIRRSFESGPETRSPETPQKRRKSA